MSGDTWLLEYENCAQFGRKIMEDINERNREAKGSSSHSKISAQIRSSLRQFGADVNKLREGLIQSAARRRITERESERRQAKLDELVSRQRQLEQAYQNDRAAAAGQRSALMGSGNPFDDSPWTGNSGYAEDARDDDPLLGITDIRQQQSQMIREQDAGLDALSNVLSRQKQMALDIGNEVDYQDEIIDDIHNHVDRTDQKIVRETKHIRIIDRKSGACCFWVIGILLFIAILVVLFVPYNGKI